MDRQLQLDTIRFFLTHKHGKHYFSFIQSDYFSDQIYAVVYELLVKFYKEFNGLPNKGNLTQYFKTELSQQATPLPEETVNEVYTSIRQCYHTTDANTDHLKSVIISEYQFKKTQDLFIKHADAIQRKDRKAIEQITLEMQKIRSLSDKGAEEQEKNRGLFILEQHGQTIDSKVQRVLPTKFAQLNNMTSKRGFAAPELIILMAAPKKFKTGIMLSILTGYMQDGYKVYYADAENGHQAIHQRVQQCMLECSSSELGKQINQEKLNTIVDLYKLRGGDFKPDFFPAYTKTLADVEQELEYLRNELDWTPDIICYDYLDLFLPKSVQRDRRHNIQQVYFNAIELQNRWGLVGFSYSQTNRQALKKQFLDIDDFGEDYGKAANAHAAFALCQDDHESKAGIMRLSPVMQRQGLSADSRASCFLEVDKSRQYVAEISKEDWNRRYKEAKQLSGNKGGKPLRIKGKVGKVEDK